MENGPTPPSPESIAFIHLLDLLLSVSKEDIEQEMKQEKTRAAKQHIPEESETLRSAT